MKAGFCRILFLNGHGGNTAPGTLAVTEMANSNDECDGVLVAFGGYWDGPAFNSEAHGMETPQATHACEFETSMMLSVAGELVHMDEAKAGPPAIDSKFYHSELGGRVTVAGRFHRKTATGAMGRPELATAEKGASLLAAAVDEVAEFVEDFLTWELPQVLKS